MNNYQIKKEEREERNDVFSIFTTEKELNETKTKIIDVEKIVRENVTKEMLQKELQDLQEQINAAIEKQADINSMITLIDNYE